ncbi:hypothetical protein ACWNX2_00020 [Candidatus Vidania fulgoroideorum]
MTTITPIYHLSHHNSPIANVINVTSTQAIKLDKCKIITTNITTYQQLKQKPNRRLKKLIKKTHIVKNLLEVTQLQQGRIKKITINNTKPINLKIGNLKINSPLQIAANITTVITAISEELKKFNINPNIKTFLYIHGQKKSYKLQ